MITEDIKDTLHTIAVSWLNMEDPDFPYDFIIICIHRPLIIIAMDSTVYQYVFNIPEIFHTDWRKLIETDAYKEYYKEASEYFSEEDLNR